MAEENDGYDDGHEEITGNDKREPARVHAGNGKPGNANAEDCKAGTERTEL